MKAKSLLALLPAVCLCWPATLRPAPQSQPEAPSPIASGSIAGVLKDPTGAVVAAAEVAVKNLSTGVSISQETNLAGRFAFDRLPACLLYTSRCV